MGDVTEFGRWLDAQMTREDLNTVGLAARMGLSHVTISKWRSGAMGPSPRNIRKLASVLHVPVTDVYQALSGVVGMSELPQDVRDLLADYYQLSAVMQRAVRQMIRAVRASESQAVDGSAGAHTVP